jgi:hypothetical protein
MRQREIKLIRETPHPEFLCFICVQFIFQVIDICVWCKSSFILDSLVTINTVTQSHSGLRLIATECDFKPVICRLKIMFAVSFANNLVLRPPLFAVNVVSKLPCLQFYLWMFAVCYI